MKAVVYRVIISFVIIDLIYSWLPKLLQNIALLGFISSIHLRFPYELEEMLYQGWVVKKAYYLFVLILTWLLLVIRLYLWVKTKNLASPKSFKGFLYFMGSFGLCAFVIDKIFIFFTFGDFVRGIRYMPLFFFLKPPLIDKYNYYSVNDMLNDFGYLLIPLTFLITELKELLMKPNDSPR